MFKKRKPNRLGTYNYDFSGSYFITICTKNRVHFFGKITNNKINLSKIGEIAKKCWDDLCLHFDDIETDEFVVMPNHIHGIIHILPKPIVGTRRVDARHAWHPQNALHLQDNNGDRKHQRLPVIIGSYKSAVSKLSNRSIGPYFRWQRSYHDRIIRNTFELQRIRNYIYFNPYNWENDSLIV